MLALGSNVNCLMLALGGWQAPWGEAGVLHRAWGEPASPGGVLPASPSARAIRSDVNQPSPRPAQSAGLILQG